MPSSSTSIVILGMHRSGTSALAGALAHLGVATGNRLLSAREDINNKGFWEHRDVVRIDDDLLFALRSSWHDTRSLPTDWWGQGTVASFRAQLLAVLKRDFSSVPLWLVKDPRICRLLPLWVGLLTEIGAQARFVLSLRHPLEVARSLARRDGMPSERANLLWLTHTLAAESGSRGQPRTVVSFDRLLADWRGEMRRVAADLDIPLGLGQPDVEARTTMFLEPSLRHHRIAGETTPDGPLAELATRCYRLLVSQPSGDALARQLAPIQRETVDAQRTFAPWEQQIQEAAALRRGLEDRLMSTTKSSQVTVANLGGELRWIKQSRSWKYTRPFRFPTVIHRFLRSGERHKYEYQVNLNDEHTVPPKVVRMVGNDRHVLEVGAGPGTITRLLKEHGRCRVTAVEIDDEAIAKLAPLCENVFRCDLNDADWIWKVYSEGPFEVVVVADVLEHLSDPCSTLRAIGPLLGEHGELVLSLPHVGHSAVLASLADENFDYRDWGLLDRTHIKFFGIKNIQALLNEAGYQIMAAEFVVKHPTETEFAEAWLHASPELKRGLASNPFGSVYQVVVKARLATAGETGLDLLSVPVPSAASAWRDWLSS